MDSRGLLGLLYSACPILFYYYFALPCSQKLQLCNWEVREIATILCWAKTS